jgi:hypothetical protein
MTKLITFFSLKVGWVRPKRGCLLTVAYYAFPRWYEFGEPRWNDILTGENRRTRRKTCPSATLSTTNPTWIDPGANPGLRGERPATDDLSHGTAQVNYITERSVTLHRLGKYFFPVFLKIIRPVQKVFQIKCADLNVFYTYVNCYKMSRYGLT